MRKSKDLQIDIVSSRSDLFVSEIILTHLNDFDSAEIRRDLLSRQLWIFSPRSDLSMKCSKKLTSYLLTGLFSCCDSCSEGAGDRSHAIRGTAAVLTLLI